MPQQRGKVAFLADRLGGSAPPCAPGLINILIHLGGGLEVGELQIDLAKSFEG
jgi:hypothetical protein